MSSQNAKTESLQIYARVRGLMPWEPNKVSLNIVGNSLQNKAGSIVNSYDFRKVFKPESTNEQCFKIIALPMISNVLKGFNAVLIAYGQTGSGKTYSMLGKPKLGIVGILPRMLEYMTKQKSVQKVELSAVEAFGHHVAKIFLFDLFDADNQIKDWSLKKGVTTLEMANATKVDISTHMDAHDKIIFAHAASHFAPTGKNPESSRGHVSFIAKIHQQIDLHKTQISYFVMVDCAGSEGESAFTPEFKAMITPQVLLCRRLEAGTINTGLSQLQVIFNELRKQGKISQTVGNGLRRVLHPYINTKTYLSVLFTVSPSINNSKATESTLKFAVTAGMVKVKPIQTGGKVNFKSLIKELKAHIEAQERMIDANNNTIAAIRRQQDRTQLAINQKANPEKFGQKQQQITATKMVKVQREVVNADGDIEIIEEYEEQTYVVADGYNGKGNGTENVSVNGQNFDGFDDEKMTEKDVELMMNELNDAANVLMNELSDDIRSEILSKNAMFEKEKEADLLKEFEGLFENESDEQIKAMMDLYNNMTPWQKEAFVKKRKAEILKKEKEENEFKESANQGLSMINAQIEQSQNDYKRLQEQQRELKKKLEDPSYAPQKMELTDHALELQIMLANQESVTLGLNQSKQIIMDFLKDDGREALIQFFKMRMNA